MKLSWSPLLPCFWFRGQRLLGTHSLWDSLGHQFSSPSQQTLTSSFVLQSHCPPFSVSFLNFTSTPMSLFCISIFSWRPHISHQASCELRCLCATGPGHIHIRMGDKQSQSCFSVVSLLNLLATLRSVPSQVSVSRQSSALPASECSQGLFPFLSFIHSAVMQHLDVPGTGQRKEVLSPWNSHSVMDQATGRIKICLVVLSAQGNEPGEMGKGVLVSRGTLTRRGHRRKVMAAVMRGDGSLAQVGVNTCPIAVTQMVIKAFSPCENTREIGKMDREEAKCCAGASLNRATFSRGLSMQLLGAHPLLLSCMGPCCFLDRFSLMAHLLNDSSPKLILVSLFLTFIRSHGLLSCPMTSATLGCRQGDNIIWGQNWGKSRHRIVLGIWECTFAWFYVPSSWINYHCLDVYDVANLTWPNYGGDITSRTTPLTIFGISVNDYSIMQNHGLRAYMDLSMKSAPHQQNISIVWPLITSTLYHTGLSHHPLSQIMATAFLLIFLLWILLLSPLSRKQPEWSVSELRSCHSHAQPLCCFPTSLGGKVEVHTSTTLNVKSDALNDIINFCFFLSHPYKQHSLWISEYL